MNYVLSWNDEYLDMQIICGPMDEAAARQAMKKEVMRKLVELNLAEDTKVAEKMYLVAESTSVEGETNDMHVNSNGASIIYGTGYEERYQIVDYE